MQGELTPMSRVNLDEQGRIMLPADLIARLKMNPGDEFVIGEATADSTLLKKKDLLAILDGVIKEARHVDLDSWKETQRTKATGLHVRNTRFLLDTNLFIATAKDGWTGPQTLI